MKIIIKKYIVYNFDELDKKIQDGIINFRFMTMFDCKTMGQVVGNQKALSNAYKLILKQCRLLSYLKNGKIYSAK